MALDLLVMKDGNVWDHHQMSILFIQPFGKDSCQSHVSIVGLATPPTPKDPWMTAEVMSMWQTHIIPPLESNQASLIVKESFPNISDTLLSKLLAFNSEIDQLLQKNESEELQTLRLSLRQLLRIASQTQHVEDL